jgi:hypothetical protein
VKRVAAFVVLAALVAGGVWRARRPGPPLPPATAHCASGLGGVALCSEWAGDTSGDQQMCQRLEGSWGELGCPANVSAAAGTCTIRTAVHTGTIRYGSAWKGRAAAHCRKLSGRFTDGR